jgi:ubiquinone/menaquinone biosynthesis C-methylase UbiE
MTAREFLEKKIKKEFKEYFGVTDTKYLNIVVEAWLDDKCNSNYRWETIKSLVGEKRLKTATILDMASGCGTFVFGGLLKGYDVYGVEPESWKHEFNIIKAKENNYPDLWLNRFCYGKGECLPYGECVFDIVSTYQTLEHVQKIEECIKEFNRVLVPGGTLIIGCPDYTSTFEGHYRVPMLPLMNQRLFKLYLKFLRKPVAGLDTLNYVTKPVLLKYLCDKFEIIDLDIVNIRRRIQKKIILTDKMTNRMARIYMRLTSNIFTRENNINILAMKK